MLPWRNKEWERVLTVLDLRWRSMPRLSPAAPSRVSRTTAKALSSNSRSRRWGVCDADRSEAQAEAQVLGIAEAGLHRPPFRVELADLRRGRGAVAGDQAPGLLHVLGVHAHDRADRALRLGDHGIAQLARPTALADPLGRR